MANIAGYKFSNKHHSGKGILSLAFGVGACIMLVALIVIASKMHGKGSIYLGSSGLVSMMFSLIGFVIGVIGFFDSDCYKLFPRIGVIFNMVMLMVWASIFMIGA